MSQRMMKPSCEHGRLNLSLSPQPDDEWPTCDECGAPFEIVEEDLSDNSFEQAEGPQMSHAARATALATLASLCARPLRAQESRIWIPPQPLRVADLARTFAKLGNEGAEEDIFEDLGEEGWFEANLVSEMCTVLVFWWYGFGPMSNCYDLQIMRTTDGAMYVVEYMDWLEQPSRIIARVDGESPTAFADFLVLLTRDPARFNVEMAIPTELENRDAGTVSDETARIACWNLLCSQGREAFADLFSEIAPQLAEPDEEKRARYVLERSRRPFDQYFFGDTNIRVDETKLTPEMCWRILNAYLDLRYLREDFIGFDENAPVPIDPPFPE